MGSGRLVLNCARCTLCNEVLVSIHRHDFKMCLCGNLAVDGGKEYIRRAISNGWDTMEEYSEYEDQLDLPN